MAGVSAARAQRAPYALPGSLKIGWRARVTAPLSFDPVADTGTKIVIVHERGTISQLDGSGKTEWSLRLSDATPNAGPALLSDGSRAILNHENTLVRLSRRGAVLSRTPTDLNGTAGPLLALKDGGLAISAKNRLVRIDHRALPIGQAEATCHVLTLVESSAGVMAVCKTGVVYRFYSTGKLSEVGRFEADLRTAALAGGALYAITSDHRLLSLDLTHKLSVTLFRAAPKQNLIEWLALTPEAVHIASADGIVRAISPTGKPVWQTASVASTPASSSIATALGSVLVGVTGSNGRLAIARAGSELLLLEKDVSRKQTSGAACLSPTALTPIGGGRLLLSCRSGELFGLEASR
jgi:DNA-binding beta-propeller fold protein YncE